MLGLETPVERLQHMNQPAYEFYLNRNPGIDLAADRLEIGVCAQHNNGGIDVDLWWRSSIAGLFPVGEAAGAHGVARPGGAALNSARSGQRGQPSGSRPESRVLLALTRLAGVGR